MVSFAVASRRAISACWSSDCRGAAASLSATLGGRSAVGVLAACSFSLVLGLRDQLRAVDQLELLLAVIDQLLLQRCQLLAGQHVPLLAQGVQERVPGLQIGVRAVLRRGLDHLDGFVGLLDLLLEAQELPALAFLPGHFDRRDRLGGALGGILLLAGQSGHQGLGRLHRGLPHVPERLGVPQHPVGEVVGPVGRVADGLQRGKVAERVQAGHPARWVAVIVDVQGELVEQRRHRRERQLHVRAAARDGVRLRQGHRAVGPEGSGRLVPEAVPERRARVAEHGGHRRRARPREVGAPVNSTRPGVPAFGRVSNIRPCRSTT
jgi:hypothetical protein